MFRYSPGRPMPKMVRDGRLGAMDVSMKARRWIQENTVFRTLDTRQTFKLPGQFQNGRFSGTGKMALLACDEIIFQECCCQHKAIGHGLLFQVWHTQKGMLVYEGQYKDAVLDKSCRWPRRLKTPGVACISVLQAIFSPCHVPMSLLAGRFEAWAWQVCVA